MPVPRSARLTCGAPTPFAAAAQRTRAWGRSSISATRPRTATVASTSSGRKDGSFAIDTRRTRLRPWRKTDREAFAGLNSDPEVARDLGGPLGRAASDAKLDRYI